jgi:hypothetical protein
MNEATRVIDSIRKDWGLIPNASKAFAIFSGLASWYVAAEWKTEKNKQIFFIVVLALNFLVLVTLIFIKPYWLRRTYSLSNFLKGRYELLDDGGIWFVVDHEKKQIRWIANMATFVELGFRHPAALHKEGQPIIESLKRRKLEGYKSGRYIMIMGRRGENIKEE